MLFLSQKRLFLLAYFCRTHVPRLYERLSYTVEEGYVIMSK